MRYDDGSTAFIPASTIPVDVPTCDWGDHRLWGAQGTQWPHTVAVRKVTDLICAANSDGHDAADFAIWTETEIRRRFSGLPVEYYAARDRLAEDADAFADHAEFERNAMVHAVEKNNVAVVRLMLAVWEQTKMRVDAIRRRDSHGDVYTLLETCAREPEITDVTRLLLDAGASPFVCGSHDGAPGAWERLVHVDARQSDEHKQLAVELARTWSVLLWMQRLQFWKRGELPLGHQGYFWPNGLFAVRHWRSGRWFCDWNRARARSSPLGWHVNSLPRGLGLMAKGLLAGDAGGALPAELRRMLTTMNADANSYNTHRSHGPQSKVVPHPRTGRLRAGDHWSIRWHQGCKVESVRFRVISIMLTAQRIRSSPSDGGAVRLLAPLPPLPSEIWLQVLGHFRAPFDLVGSVFDLITDTDSLPPMCASTGYSPPGTSIEDPVEANELTMWVQTVRESAPQLSEHEPWITDWLSKINFEEYGPMFAKEGIKTEKDLDDIVQGDHSTCGRRGDRWRPEGAFEPLEFVDWFSMKHRGGKLESKSERRALAEALKKFM